MEIILTKNCMSLTGSIGRGFGYFIQARRGKGSNKRFFSQRSKHGAPPDGHWKMICACANLAEMKLHIADIKVEQQELIEALREAGVDDHRALLSHHWDNIPSTFNASDILKLKNNFNL